MWCPETESYRQPRWADTLWRRAKKSPITKDEALFNMVPGDRIELPTRGFSIPCSTD